MTGDELQKLLNSQPFRPFTIWTADGAEIPIPSREFVSYEPGRRTFHVMSEDLSYDSIDLLLVVRANVGPPTGKIEE